MQLAMASSWRVASVSNSPWRVKVGHGELLSTTTYVFVVLGFRVLELSKPLQTSSELI